MFVKAFDSMMPHRRLELSKLLSTQRNRGPDLLAWVVSAFISGRSKRSRTRRQGQDSFVKYNGEHEWYCFQHVIISGDALLHDLCSSFKLPEQARMIAAVIAAATGDDAEDTDNEDEDDSK